MPRARRPSRIAALALPLASVLVAASVAAADSPPPRGQNEIGGSLFYLEPRSPMEGGAGIALRYARGLPWGGGSPSKTHPWALQFGVAYTSLDRKAEGDLPKGTIRFTRLSAGATRALGDPARPWTFAVGAHLDVYIAGAGDTTVTGPPIGIASRLDASTGAGGRLAVEAARRFGTSSRFFASLSFVGASLDGTRRYVIDDVAGAPTSVKIDLTGPEVDLGYSYRF